MWLTAAVWCLLAVLSPDIVLELHDLCRKLALAVLAHMFYDACFLFVPDSECQTAIANAAMTVSDTS